MGDLLREELSLRVKLASYEVPLAGFFHCPHHPEDTVSSFSMDCRCRKPDQGLLIQAARELNVDLTH